MGVSWGGEWHGIMPLACPSLPVVLWADCFKKCSELIVSVNQTLGWAMWVSIASDAVCAAVLQQAVVDFGVVDADALQAVLQVPETAAGFARALCTALRAAPPAAAAAPPARAAEIGTMTEVSVVDMCTQATADDAADTATAEAMVAEALQMVDEAKERERLAEERARSFQSCTELATSLLKAAEDRTDRAQAARLAAERLAAAEHAAMQMAVQLLAAEAALADAAVERALHEGAVRAQAEAQRDISRALAGGRGGRGGRGRHGHPHPPPPPSPPQPPQPSQPPPPPPLAELIVLVLAVPIETEGQMTAEEALAIFNVTHRSPRWLLAQVHPDKHPHHTSQAEAATARVNQARDIRSRHVTDWTQ